jgi:phage terminase large subunit-like protein
LRAVDAALPLRSVHASRGKRARAEPVAALYEQGRVRHVGAFPALEDQMVNWEATGAEASPDRLDALVWALTDLMLGRSGEPRLRRLGG